jgi:hypothetical protein
MAVQIIFSNLSPVGWSINWNLNAEPGLKTVKQAPAKTLAKPVGREVLWIEQERLGWWVRGNYDCSCLLASDDQPQTTFGVSVHVPLQWATLGPGPYWGFAQRNAQGDFVWTDQMPDQATPYILKAANNIQIRVDPTCAHDGIQLQVNISQHK